MAKPEQSHLPRPYPGDGIGLNWQQFVDRVPLKEDFAKEIRCTWSETNLGQPGRLDVVPHSGQLPDWAWVVEGRRGFGKSAFAAWCRGIQKQVDQQKDEKGTFIVTYASPDLCANASVSPLEAALHRLRGQVLQQLGRIHDGRYLGWYSAGEVLRMIAEEAHQKADAPNRLRCIVFILDNVSILPAATDEKHWNDRAGLSEIERQVASLIAELSRLDAEGFGRAPRPAVGLIALAYPDFYGRVSVALRSRFAKYKKLDTFKLEGDVETFASRYLGTDDEGVVAMLFYLSGGVPDLLQVITKQLVEEARRREGCGEPSPNNIDANAILGVAQNPDEEFQSHLIEHFWDRGLAKMPFSEKDEILFGILSTLVGTKLRSDAVPTEKFLTSAEFPGIAAQCNSTSKRVEEVLEFLVKAGILLKPPIKEPDAEASAQYDFGIGALVMNLNLCIGEP
jgi:hypothetical protein